MESVTTRQGKQFITNMTIVASLNKTAETLVARERPNFVEVLAQFFWTAESKVRSQQSKEIKLCMLSPENLGKLPAHVALFKETIMVDYDPLTQTLAVLNGINCNPIFQGLAGLDALYQLQVKSPVPKTAEDVIVDKGYRHCSAAQKFTLKLLSYMIGLDGIENEIISASAIPSNEPEIRIVKRIYKRFEEFAPTASIMEVELRRRFISDLVEAVRFASTEPKLQKV